MSIHDIPVGLRAITIRQPWIHHILRGEKRLENRSWQPPTLPIILALHAAKSPDMEDYREALSELEGDPTTLTTMGAIVGLIQVGKIHTRRRDVPTGQKDWWGGPCAWEIERVVPLATPVPCKGQLGLWTVPANIRSKLVLT